MEQPINDDTIFSERRSTEVRQTYIPTKLTHFERKLLNELCEVLEPFESATVIVQKEKSVSASLAIPTSLQLKHALRIMKCGKKDLSEKSTGKPERQTITFIESLEKSINLRLAKYEQEEEYVLATMLDPRFKLDWCHPDNYNYKGFEEMLLSKIQQEQKISEMVTEDITPPRKIAKGENFFSFMEASSPARKRHQSGPRKINTEVETYLTESCIYRDDDPLKYWSRNSISKPLLSRLAEKYLSIPCTSAPVERLFSVAGNIFRPRRAKMNDNTFQNLMMIKWHNRQELGCPFWDVVVLTAADESQKNVYEKQLEYKYQRQELPLDVEILVVADPPGPKIGNGGSTIVSLEALHEKFGEKLFEYKVLLIHAGGQSQRMPSASVLGKIFSPIPRGNPIYQMLDIKLAMFCPLIPKMPKGVFVTCADDFLVYDLGDKHDDIKFSESGFTALAHPSSLAVGTGHGVYVVEDIGKVNPKIPLMVCKCLEVLQKPSEVEMYKKGAVLKAGFMKLAEGVRVENKAAFTDSSFFFAHDISMKLLTFAAENGPLSCEIDAYGDFLQALGPRATSGYINNTSNVSVVTPGLYETRKKVFNLLNESDITLLVMNCSKFIHIGTTKEYIEYFCCDDTFQAEMGLEKDVFNLWTKNGDQTRFAVRSGSGDASDQPPPQKCLKLSDTSLGCVMHSYLPTESYTSATSVIEFCSFSIPVKVGQCCILSNCEFKADIRVKDLEGKKPFLVEYMNTVQTLEFPNNLFLHTIPIREEGQTKYVTVFFDIKENLKKEAPERDVKRLPFLGKLVEDFTAVSGADLAIVAPDIADTKVNLWHANLFPVTDDASESLLLALQCVNAVKTDKTGAVTLTSLRLVSMATVLKEKDLEAMLDRRNILYNTIRSM